MDRRVPSEVLGSCECLETDITSVSRFKWSCCRIHAQTIMLLRGCEEAVVFCGASTECGVDPGTVEPEGDKLTVGSLVSASDFTLPNLLSFILISLA